MLRLIISGNSIESSSSGISSGSDGESSPVKPAEPRRERLYHSRPVGASSTAASIANETAPAPVPSSSNVMSQIRRFFRPSTSSNDTVSFTMKTAWSAYYACFYHRLWFTAHILRFDFKFYRWHAFSRFENTHLTESHSFRTTKEPKFLELTLTWIRIGPSVSPNSFVEPWQPDKYKFNSEFSFDTISKHSATNIGKNIWWFFADFLFQSTSKSIFWPVNAS